MRLVCVRRRRRRQRRELRRRQFDSTFELIQNAIFKNRGCTSGGCHNAAAAGGLDLPPDVAYDNLRRAAGADVSAETFPGLRRIVPGQQGAQLAVAQPGGGDVAGQWKAPLRPMPQGGLPPLSLDELEVVRLWIEYGAPRDGVVAGTGELLDACLPPPEPIEIAPLPPPPPGVGVQMRMPHLVPAAAQRARGMLRLLLRRHGPGAARVPRPERHTFRYKRIDARQDPISHHCRDHRLQRRHADRQSHLGAVRLPRWRARRAALRADAISAPAARTPCAPARPLRPSPASATVRATPARIGEGGFSTPWPTSSATPKASTRRRR